MSAQGSQRAASRAASRFESAVVAILGPDRVRLQDGRIARLQGLGVPALAVRDPDFVPRLTGFLRDELLGRRVLVCPEPAPARGDPADLLVVLREGPGAVSVNHRALAAGLALLSLRSRQVTELVDLRAAARRGQQERRGYWARADRRAFHDLPYLNGAVLGLHYEDDEARYDRQLAELARLGFRHVTLLFASFLDNATSTEIRTDRPRCVGDRQLLETIARAKELGMSVMLLPILLLENAGEDEWRGVLRPADEELFWLNYDAFLCRYLDLAEAASVEIFCLGSELGSLEDRTEAWGRLIVNARGRFRGLLTYSANWDHAHVPRFFGDLDLIGMTAYFSLTERDDPSLDDLVRAWRRVGRQVAGQLRRHGKPVVFTELGYASQDGINRDPWNYYINREAIDLQEQADCFSAFLQVAPEFDWLRGAYFYDYFDPGGPRDHGYSPRGKPALQVWRRWAVYEPPR